MQRPRDKSSSAEVPPTSLRLFCFQQPSASLARPPTSHREGRSDAHPMVGLFVLIQLLRSTSTCFRRKFIKFLAETTLGIFRFQYSARFNQASPVQGAHGHTGRQEIPLRSPHPDPSSGSRLWTFGGWARRNSPAKQSHPFPSGMAAERTELRS